MGDIQVQSDSVFVTEDWEPVDLIECPFCGEVVKHDDYSFTEGMCWECQEDEDEDHA